MSAKNFSKKQRAALAALQEDYGSSLESFLALRPDSYEHLLAAQSLEHLEQFYAVLFTPGESLDKIVPQCPPWPKASPQAGEQPNKSTLSRIKNRFFTESTLNGLGQVSEFLEKIKKRATALPAGQQTEVLDAIVTMVGEELVQAKLGGSTIAANLPVLDRLLSRDHGKAVVRLREQEISIKDRRTKILEAKAAAFDKVSDVVKQNLSPEEQKKRLKEILK